MCAVEETGFRCRCRKRFRRDTCAQNNKSNAGCHKIAADAKARQQGLKWRILSADSHISLSQTSQPRRAAAQRRSWPSAEDTRKFVDSIVADNGWDNDCRSRLIRFEADGQSFKVKVPRRSRAGDNDSIGAVQMAVRLDKMMRQTASLTGRAWDGWRQEQLAWLFSPHQPSYYAKSD